MTQRSQVALSLTVVVAILLLVLPYIANAGGGLADWWKDGAHVAQRTGADFISGENVTITAVDDPGDNRVRYTISSTGGGGGGPAVQSKTLILESPVAADDFPLIAALVGRAPDAGARCAP